MLSDGARQLPLRHLSIRVPWHDTDWTGKVCQKPKDNLSCLILGRIRDTRDDDAECALAGRRWTEIPPNQLPACLSERGNFMCPQESTRTLNHPYVERSQAHAHFGPTPYRHPAYSAACIPFNWMLKENAPARTAELELGFAPELEQKATELMGFTTAWLQSKHNQLLMLDTFFSAIQPNQSLCFFYAKRTPLVEDTRRVLVGVGRVTAVANAVEYCYQQPGALQSMIWDRAVQHSIRPAGTEGFLLPYHEVLAYLGSHPEEDPTPYVAFVPDDQFWSFSFTSEHVTNDGAIAALLACDKALQNIASIVPGNWDQARDWIDKRLSELWRMRGPCPGLGSALTAFGIEKGTLLAYELERIMAAHGGDPWPVVDKLLREPRTFQEALRKHVTATTSRKWIALPAERRALLQLLSRFELLPEQATRYYVHEDGSRQELRIDCNDSDLLKNPYELYERDRVAPAAIALGTVDRGVFPDPSLREKYALPAPSRVDDPTDARRVRAFIVQELELAALEGHTLQTRSQVVRRVRAQQVQPELPLDVDMMNVLEKDLAPSVTIVRLADGTSAYQLKEQREFGEVIRNAVQRRVRGRRHEAQIDWRERLDRELTGPVGDETEESARQEKTAALQELFASRLSVLAGAAGTGKTTVVRVLCKAPEVQAGGVLVLAPTGKARVKINIPGAQTIAQFLLDKDRYYGPTGTYRLSTAPKVDIARTVIIDECSMLTEAMLAAVLDALDRVDRLVLVGDPRQLPPIGAGRPFLDIVRALTPENAHALFPLVVPGLAELTVVRRQQATGTAETDRFLDLELAKWFSGRPLEPGDDEVWSQVTDADLSPRLRLVRWDNSDELQEKLLQVLVEELRLQDATDAAAFEQTLGGAPYAGRNYFWPTTGSREGAATRAEAWQILSPVRNLPHGVDALNRTIQTRFRGQTARDAHLLNAQRRIPKPIGPQGILYGDKVINLVNHRHRDVYPKQDALAYVANGEVGIVVGQFKGRNWPFRDPPWKLQVEFASQLGFSYGFGGKDFGEEGDPPLELAYALTIHKAQGSEFGLTIVVLPNPCRLLSRELLYTALTRQHDRLVILHQGDFHELRAFSDDYHSDAAARLTNLLHAPNLVRLPSREQATGKAQGPTERFLEQELIHSTLRGEPVRSKSEVIIANMLHARNIEYRYEQPLLGKSGAPRYPDFTIADDETGAVFYWEHLGKLREPTYRRKWERKLQWYASLGILPAAQGGGPNGTLLTSQDDERGGIDCAEIERLIELIQNG